MGRRRLLIYKYKTKSLNPYYNLALEKFFLEYSKKEGAFILYFWQNSDTVVIGRNQEAKVECNLDLMKEKNILLLRRETGGGAVFHDKNNLNFSFIVPKNAYNTLKSMEIIKNAIKTLNFEAEISGRNDILINGKKISGNAYYKSKDSVLHHGTILIDTDFKKMESVLTPDISKLQTGCVKSVKSRVLNLKEIRNISIKEIEKAIEKEFLNYCKDYIQEPVIKPFKIKNHKAQIIKQKRIYKSKKWLYGEDFKFSYLAKKKKFKDFDKDEIEFV